MIRVLIHDLVAIAGGSVQPQREFASDTRLQEIARRLGHSNVEMTWNTYSHLYPQEEERAISILNKIFMR